MNAEDPRLTAFALDALPAAERIQVQRVLAENPLLTSELDAIEEFSSRLGRAFHQGSRTSLDEEQWAEILNVATPQAIPIPVSHPENQTDWAKAFSPWVLPLAATLVATAIVISTMFYKPAARQPVEAVMIAKLEQHEEPMIFRRFVQPKSSPATSIANSAPPGLHQNPLLSATIAEQHSAPANSTPKVGVSANRAPLESTPASDSFDLAVSEGFIQYPVTSSVPEKAHEPDAAVMTDENGRLYPQPSGFSSFPTGGGSPPPSGPAADTTQQSIAEKAVPKKAAANFDNKHVLASNQTQKQPLETAAQTSTPKSTRPKSTNTAPSASPENLQPAQHGYEPTEVPEPQPDPQLASYEGRQFGDLPPELVPEDYEIIDEHHAIITLADTNTFSVQGTTSAGASNGLDGMTVNGLTTHYSGSSLRGATSNIASFSLDDSAGILSLIPAPSAETPKKINVSVYSADGVFDNFHPDDLDGLMILSISPP